jgi:hypothetical protein
MIAVPNGNRKRQRIYCWLMELLLSIDRRRKGRHGRQFLALPLSKSRGAPSLIGPKMFFDCHGRSRYAKSTSRVFEAEQKSRKPRFMSIAITFAATVQACVATRFC